MLTALALTASACGSSSSSKGAGGATSSKDLGKTTGAIGGKAGFPSTVPLNKGSVKGGTLNIGSVGDVDYLDPARTYYAFSWDLHQLTNRTLLTFPDGVGSNATTPTGDIATGPATPQKNNTVFSYTLKPGVKFQDGTTVTSSDIKYAIERTFATDVINGGPTYFQTFLDDKANPYPGPYKDKSAGHLGLKSITTPDASHITFTLNQPFAEWNYVMTLFGTSPVERSVDLNNKTGGANYNNHVQATGPYMIGSYVANKHIDLVRNPAWSQATDPTRTALPDAINVTTNLDADTSDANIIANTEDLDIGGTGVQPNTQAKVLRDKTLASRSLDPLTGFTRYISILQQSPPFDNIHCRKAIEWAVSKQNQVNARGGTYGGAVASTMAPPTLAGYKAFDLYPTTNGAANVAKAKSELSLCGKPNGFTTTIVVTNSGKGPQQAQFLQNDLKAVGITAKIKTFDAATYYSSVVGVPANIKKDGYGLAFAGWGPDWPAPYGFYENIIDPRKILPQGNSNYGGCKNPAISSDIDQALKQTSSNAEYPFWQKADMQVLSDACDVPYSYDKALDLFSSRLKNVYIEPNFGIVDVRTLGVM